ncbi:hypothetical protein FACS189494_03960 [Spirochaetia bacterium]|nr:hypothetical protein FACS189494_03960 [Spirochaetia bacterium]
MSPDLKAQFNEYPSIEVDMVALDAAAEAEIKQAGVENYFAPDSGVRSKTGAKTFFFSQEQTKVLTFESRDQAWFKWLRQKPVKLVVIASIPHDPSMAPSPDPRIISISMKPSIIFSKTLNVLIEPKSLTVSKTKPKPVS